MMLRVGLFLCSFAALLAFSAKGYSEEKPAEEKSVQEEPKQEEEKEKSKIKIEPYGYVKLDIIYDDSTPNNADFASWVEPFDMNDANFAMHARQTRFGVWFLGQEVLKAESKARIEFDLSGGGTDNKYIPGIRHAYFQLDWKRFSLLGGQAWDVLSPLNMDTVNYMVGWFAGNIGFRRTMLRVDNRQPIGKGTLRSSLAIARNIGTDAGAYGGPQDTGGDYTAPQVQGRIGFHSTTAGWPAQIGLSGHYSREDFGSLLGKFDSYSANLDVMAVLGKYFLFKGEAFYGANLDALLGGIGQGVNPDLATSIRTIGGWGMLKVTPKKWFAMNLGAGIDDPKNADLSTEMRSRNLMAFVNLNYIPAPIFKISLEYSYWKTDYIDIANATNNRIQLAFIYNLPR